MVYKMDLRPFSFSSNNCARGLWTTRFNSLHSQNLLSTKSYQYMNQQYDYPYIVNMT
jgi:hypothetical protein